MSSGTTESQLSGSNTDPTVSGSSASLSAAPAKAIRSKPHPGSLAQPARKQPGKQTSKVQAPTDEIIVIDEMAVDVPSRSDYSNLNLNSTVGGGILIELTDTSDSEQSTCADTTAVTEEGVNMAIPGREDSTTHHALGNDDRERLWKCAMDADLRGDLAASEMFCRLLKVETKPVNVISTKPKPPPPPAKHRATPVPIKRIPPQKTESKTPVPLPEKAVRLDDKPVNESVKEGGLVFTSGAVLKHTSLGFNAFFERNIRELKSPLPLTIFNKEWQEASLTCHVHKRSKNSKDHRYAGHSYPSEWSQNYASWTMNHRNFHTTLRDVYGLTDFADKMLKHKENVDHLHSVHGFLPAFRYDLLMRADTFSRRVTVNGIPTVPDISKFRKDLWETCYAQSQRLDELNFNENPYCEGGVRQFWDPVTGARKGARENFRPMVHDLYPEMNKSPRPYKRAPDDKPVEDYPARSARGGFGIDRGRDKRSEPLWDSAARGPAWTEQHLVPRGDR